MEYRNNVNLSLFIQLAKVNNNRKMNEKRIQEYQSMDREYVTGKIVVFWSFFRDDLVVWFLHRLKNLNML